MFQSLFSWTLLQHEAEDRYNAMVDKFQSLFSWTLLQLFLPRQPTLQVSRFQSLFSWTLLQLSIGGDRGDEHGGVSILVFPGLSCNRSFCGRVKREVCSFNPCFLRLFCNVSRMQRNRSIELCSFNPCFLRLLCNYLSKDIGLCGLYRVSILIFLDSFATTFLLKRKLDQRNRSISIFK